MIEALLEQYGLRIEKSITVYGTFYSLYRDGNLIMNTTRDDLLITGLLIIIADLSSDNNRLLKELALNAIPD